MTTTECRSERGNMTESERQRVTREWRVEREREQCKKKREKLRVKASNCFKH